MRVGFAPARNPTLMPSTLVREELSRLTVDNAEHLVVAL